MSIVIDPAGRETKALRRTGRWRGKRLLEIGCGNGRLTLRLAALGAESIHAIDPDAKQLRQARAGFPPEHARRVRFRVGKAERLPYRAREFDCVVFAWAL